MTRRKTDYGRIQADPSQRVELQKEELILAGTNAIAEEMERQGVTKAELARRIGRSRGHVHAFLDGGRNLTLGSIAEMADALGSKVDVRLEPARKAGTARRRSA
jgi:plasmid maintenance system antidote protein VapI